MPLTRFSQEETEIILVNVSKLGGIIELKKKNLKDFNQKAINKRVIISMLCAVP